MKNRGKTSDAKTVTPDLPQADKCTDKSQSNGYLEDQTLGFIVEHDVTWYEISLWAMINCPGCAPSQLLAYPQPTCCRGSGDDWGRTKP